MEERCLQGAKVGNFLDSNMNWGDMTKHFNNDEKGHGNAFPFLIIYEE